MATGSVQYKKAPVAIQEIGSKIINLLTEDRLNEHSKKELDVYIETYFPEFKGYSSGKILNELLQKHSLRAPEELEGIIISSIEKSK